MGALGLRAVGQLLVWLVEPMGHHQATASRSLTQEVGDIRPSSALGSRVLQRSLTL